MVKVRLIGRDESIGVSSVQTGFEDDGRVGAGSEVEARALGLLGRAAVEGVAVVFLRFALCFAAGEGAGVGGVGACVVLDCAGALEGGGGVDECVAFDGEGAVPGSGCDGGRSTAESAGE